MNLKSLMFLAVLITACAGNTVESPTSSEPVVTTRSEAPTSTLAPTTAAAPSTTAAPGTTAAPVLIRVEGGIKVEGPDTISVTQGEAVSFQVLADVTDEVHVHGYDLFFETVAGEVVLVEFPAEATGIFEVELEGSQLLLVDIEVTP